MLASQLAPRAKLSADLILVMVEEKVVMVVNMLMVPGRVLGLAQVVVLADIQERVVKDKVYKGPLVPDQAVPEGVVLPTVLKAMAAAVVAAE